MGRSTKGAATAAAKASRQAKAWLSCRRMALRLRRFAVILPVGSYICLTASYIASRLRRYAVIFACGEFVRVGKVVLLR